MSGSKLSDASIPPAAAQPPRRNDQPLGLTVHSLPSPESAETEIEQKKRTTRGRWKMLAVLLACAAPVIASYFTYYVIRPEGRRNFGELVQPQRPLPDMATVALDGTTGNLRSLKGQWLLVSVASAACDAACQHHLYLQRQLRESLGKEKDRLDWVWLVSDDATITPTLLPGLGKATVLRVPEASVGQWLAPAAGQQLADHLYVVDPLGNWMMRFPATLDATGFAKAKRDLERLLRASSSWDDAGR